MAQLTKIIPQKNIPKFTKIAEVRPFLALPLAVSLSSLLLSLSSPALSLVARALSPSRARCPRNPSSPHPHRSGNSSLPVPSSSSAPYPFLAWASPAPRSLVAALALSPPQRSLLAARSAPAVRCPRTAATKPTGNSSILRLSRHPPPSTPNLPPKSPCRRCCRRPSRPSRRARTPPPPPPSHDLPVGQASQREDRVPIPVDAPEPPQLVRIPGAVRAFLLGSASPAPAPSRTPARSTPFRF